LPRQENDKKISSPFQSHRILLFSFMLTLSLWRRKRKNQDFMIESAPWIKEIGMKRRKFLKTCSAGLLGFSGALVMKSSGKTILGEIKGGAVPRRRLGRTGEKLSIVALGGLVLAKEEQATANELVREAIDHGVNYFDVAPSYYDAQDRMGPALQPFRKKIFLACKTLKRDRQGAEEELNQSLLKLQTDHFDLYQMHGLTKTEDVEQALGPNGAIETFLKARKEGKIRFIGFSAHSVEAALMAMEKFAFDTILFPINFACFLKAGFGPQVVARAKERKMGILALKALARQRWPEESMRKEWPKCWYQPILDPEEAKLSFRFTLSQPITAAVPPGDARLFKRALELAHEFKPLTTEEESRLRNLASGLSPIFSSKAE
jgi:predicted aldo/keto reductase-like oxidoreductase